VLVSYYLTQSACETMPQDFAVAVGYPSGWCFQDTAMGGYLTYPSCTGQQEFCYHKAYYLSDVFYTAESTYTVNYYNDSACLNYQSSGVVDISCVNGTTMICQSGTPSAAPTSSPTIPPTFSPAYTPKPTSTCKRIT
jgi:hypothetical protein